ncbi:MAG: hypothetical protein SGPRY_013006, partial [Prymnesium sp.]
MSLVVEGTLSRKRCLSRRAVWLDVWSEGRRRAVLLKGEALASPARGSLKLGDLVRVEAREDGDALIASAVCVTRAWREMGGGAAFDPS